MRILVIGGAGYIGSVLTRQLIESEHEVTVLDRLLFGGDSVRCLLDHPRLHFHQGDLRDRTTLDRLMVRQDAVCLLAAIVGEPACNRDPKTAEETNLHGAVLVRQAAEAADVGRFVFSSTCSNYGIADEADLATEDSPLRPLSVYSNTKVAAEAEILGAASADFCTTVLRFATAFGVSARMRFDLLVSDFTLTAYRERKIVIYGERFWRPFVHVEDISRSIQRVLAAPRDAVCGQVFNIGANSENLQKIELGRLVQQEVAGTELEFKHVGSDPRSYRVDFTKAATRLNFQPRWTVHAGIREVHECLRENRWPNPDDICYRN